MFHIVGSAILHANAKEKVLFVLNHYPDAVCFTLEFADRRIKRLVNLSTGASVAVKNGVVELDVDRKCCDMFAVK